jgi:hypothetical protein
MAKVVYENIITAWDNFTAVKPIMKNEIQEIKDLRKEKSEMLLGLGFYLDPKYSDDEIEDTQYLKIIYTYTGLYADLEKIMLAK